MATVRWIAVRGWMFAEEMLCTSKEEHEALFGDAGDFDDDMEDDFEIDAMAAGLDVDE